MGEEEFETPHKSIKQFLQEKEKNGPGAACFAPLEMIHCIKKYNVGLEGKRARAIPSGVCQEVDACVNGSTGLRSQAGKRACLQGRGGRSSG